MKLREAINERKHQLHHYDHGCPICIENGPPDSYWEESFRGGEAAAYEREQMNEARKLK